MTKLTLYQIDAFAENLFEGNPAAVVPLEQWLDDDLMQKIAAENNLSETAFFVPTQDGFHIRWFTPLYEVPLCGHATLASAYVIFNQLGYTNETLCFQSKSGPLSVQKNGQKLTLDFPSQPLDPGVSNSEIEKAFGQIPIEVLKGKDYLLVFEDEDFVKNVTPDFEIIRNMDIRAVIITSKSTEYDFISRFFIPSHGIDEDPVTGSSFTHLVPYWTSKLGKPQLKARQVSTRGGNVQCELIGDRVKISGTAVNYMQATISIP